MKKYLIAALAALVLCSCTVDNFNAEGIVTENVDDFTVTWIRDTPSPRVNPLSLFPDAPASIIDSLGLQDGIPASMSSFLVRDGKHIALFDTGNGSDKSMLFPALDSLQLDESQIEYIFITHLHGDHFGGLLNGDRACFSKAKVYIPRDEYEFWMASASDRKPSVGDIALAYADRVVLFDESDSLPMDVIAIPAPGHTPGHTAYRKGKLLIVGDIMHGYDLQMAAPDLCAPYDMDKEASIHTRVELVQYAITNQMLMAGAHFREPGMVDFR